MEKKLRWTIIGTYMEIFKRVHLPMCLPVDGNDAEEFPARSQEFQHHSLLCSVSTSLS